jgi:Na+/phosphate symporter
MFHIRVLNFPRALFNFRHAAVNVVFFSAYSLIFCFRREISGNLFDRLSGPSRHAVNAAGLLFVRTCILVEVPFQNFAKFVRTVVIRGEINVFEGNMERQYVEFRSEINAF